MQSNGPHSRHVLFNYLFADLSNKVLLTFSTPKTDTTRALRLGHCRCHWKTATNESKRLVCDLFSYSSDNAGHQHHERDLRTRSWPFLPLHRRCWLPEPPTSLNDLLVALSPPPVTMPATRTTNES